MSVILTGESKVHGGQSRRVEKILSARIKQYSLAIAGWCRICSCALDFVSIVKSSQKMLQSCTTSGPRNANRICQTRAVPVRSEVEMPVVGRKVLSAGERGVLCETETGRMSSSTLARWLMHRSAGAISSSRCCQTNHHQRQTTCNVLDQMRYEVDFERSRQMRLMCR